MLGLDDDFTGHVDSVFICVNQKDSSINQVILDDDFTRIVNEVLPKDSSLSSILISQMTSPKEALRSRFFIERLFFSILPVYENYHIDRIAVIRSYLSKYDYDSAADFYNPKRLFSEKLRGVPGGVGCQGSLGSYNFAGFGILQFDMITEDDVTKFPNLRISLFPRSKMVQFTNYIDPKKGLNW